MPSSVFAQWFDAFSRTGNISPLFLGMDRQEIAGIFGDPDDHSAGSHAQRAAIWKYGSLEFHFGADGSLWLVYMDTPEGVVVSIKRVTR